MKQCPALSAQHRQSLRHAGYNITWIHKHLLIVFDVFPTTY